MGFDTLLLQALRVRQEKHLLQTGEKGVWPQTTACGNRYSVSLKASRIATLYMPIHNAVPNLHLEGKTTLQRAGPALRPYYATAIAALNGCGQSHPHSFYMQQKINIYFLYN